VRKPPRVALTRPRRRANRAPRRELGGPFVARQRARRCSHRRRSISDLPPPLSMIPLHRGTTRNAWSTHRPITSRPPEQRVPRINMRRVRRRCPPRRPALLGAARTVRLYLDHPLQSRQRGCGSPQIVVGSRRSTRCLSSRRIKHRMKQIARVIHGGNRGPCGPASLP